MNPFTSDDPARTAEPADGYEISDQDHDDALAEVIAEKLRGTHRHAATDYVIEALTDSIAGPRVGMEIGELIANGIEDDDCDDVEIGRRLRKLVTNYLADIFSREIDDRAEARHVVQAEDARDFWGEQGRAA